MKTNSFFDVLGRSENGTEMEKQYSAFLQIAQKTARLARHATGCKPLVNCTCGLGDLQRALQAGSMSPKA